MQSHISQVEEGSLLEKEACVDRALIMLLAPLVDRCVAGVTGSWLALDP
jgi:hypothetical protein